MTPIEILKAIRDDNSVRFLDDTLDKAINEIEKQEYKLKKAQSYIVDLENQIKDKTNWWMNK